jgi:hypothetical protein
LILPTAAAMSATLASVFGRVPTDAELSQIARIMEPLIEAGGLRKAADALHQATEFYDHHRGQLCSCGDRWRHNSPEADRQGIPGCQQKLALYRRAAELEGRKFE